MKDLFFVSDIHLFPEPEPHPGRERFFDFLSGLELRPEQGELWILGDLFDFWFEYGSVVPAGHSRVLAALGRLTSGGWDIHFLPGNHDFWTGRHFVSETGARVHTEQTVEMERGGRRLVLAHGDGLGRGDTGYRLMKPVLRSRISGLLFSLLHPDLGTALARAFSGTSRRVLRKEAESIPPGLEAWVDGVLADGADIVLTGHTHLDGAIQRENGLHISLGDWLLRMTYCIVPGDGGAPVLMTATESDGCEVPGTGGQ